MDGGFIEFENGFGAERGEKEREREREQFDASSLIVALSFLSNSSWKLRLTFSSFLQVPLIMAPSFGPAELHKALDLNPAARPVTSLPFNTQREANLASISLVLPARVVLFRWIQSHPGSCWGSPRVQDCR